MTNNERTAHWRAQVDQWQASGLTGSQFCKKSKLDLGQFYYWRDKLLKQPVARVTARSSGFATVVMSDAPATDSGLSFTLPNGCAIAGITATNVNLVSALLEQL